MKTLILILSWLIPAAGFAQSYSIDWHKISDGGGTSTSTNGRFSLSGTIGQPDAGGAMSGANYSLTGGFWSLVSALPTPGAPTLLIARSGNSIIISWPDTGSYTLQQNSSLTGDSWTASGFTVTTANGTNRLTISAPTGNLFLRLKGK
ncbi:MAG TPA: hypothetical protein VGO57_07850 [Verrucomicrobiae bacterium]|jgi:hypothetical protein